MWKIKIVYDDKGKVTLTGKQEDIPLRLALKYYNLYAVGRNRKTCIYQQYPKKEHPEMSLENKIAELQEEESKRVKQTT